MLKNCFRQINNRLDEESPKVYSHKDWGHSDYNYDSSNYNYDNYEVTPIEDEQSAYLSMCALANYSAGAVSSMGSLDAGTVQNVNLGMVNEHKACLASIGSTMESTIQKMGNALNVRYTAEAIAAGLFDGEEGQLLDYATYLRELADQNTTDILEQIAGFGQRGEAGATSPLTQGPQYDESIFTDPEKLASTYSDIRQKDPSEWTEEEKYIIMAYYDDLSGRIASEKAKADEAALYSYDTNIWDEYNGLYAERKQLEKVLKAEGLMEYSSWEKGWQDIKAAGAALWNEGKDVVSAVGEGDFKGALHELSEFNTQLLATGAVVTEATVSGVLKVGEYIDDGAHILLTTAATPVTYVVDKVAGTDLTDQMWDATMDDVARDKVGEAREWFYEGTPVGQYINENSTLKWDSDGAKAIQKVSTKAGEFVIAGAVTMATGGAGTPLVAAGFGFLEGTGQEAERRFNLTDEEGNYTNRSAKDVALSYLKGVGKASEWYMYGDVTRNIANGVLKKGAEAATKDVFTGNSAKDAVLNMAKKADVYVDTAASLANAGSTRLTTGKWNWGELGLDLALSVLGNYGGEYLSAVSANKAAKGASLLDATSGTASHADDALTKADDIVEAHAATQLTDGELAGVWGAGDGTPISPKTDSSVFSPAKQAQLDELVGSPDVPTARFTDYDSYDQAVVKAKARLDDYDPRLTGFYEEGKMTGAKKPHFIAYEEHNYLHVGSVADESKKVSNALNTLIDEGHVTGLSKLDDEIVEAAGLCHDLGMREGGHAILYDKASKTFSSPQEIVDDFGKKIRQAHPSVSATTVLESGIGGENKEMIAALDFLHSKSNSGVRNVVSNDEIMGMLKALSDGADSGHYTFDITKFVDEVDGQLVPKPEEFAKLKSGAIALRAGDARAAKTGFNQAGEMIDVVKHADPAKTFSQTPGLRLEALCNLEADDCIVDIVSRDGARTAVAGAGDNAFSRRIVIGERNARSVDVEAIDGMLTYTDEVLTESSPASTLKHGIVEKFGEYFSYKDAVKQKQIIKLPEGCSDDLFNFYKQYLPEEEIVKDLGIKGDINFDYENKVISFIFGGGN